MRGVETPEAKRSRGVKLLPAYRWPLAAIASRIIMPP